MKISKIHIAIISLFFGFLTGCAEITPPTPKDIIDRPLGTSSLRIGMSREEIKSLWGNPDEIKVLSSDAQGMVKEEWVYQGRYPDLPISAGYLSRTQHLIFDGEYLVEFYQQK